MLPRAVMAVAPVLALITAGFGLLNIYTGALALRGRNYPVGLISIGMGFAGIVLSIAVWRVWKQMRSRKSTSGK
jgi:hypothetical protein